MRKEEIDELAGLLEHSTVTKLEITGENWTLRLVRPVVKLEEGATPAPTGDVAGPVHIQSEPVEANGSSATVVDAPMVGVFHHNKPSVALGRSVRAGDVLGQIEALTLLSEIQSPVEGEIVDISVDDGQPVEYGQPLFSLQPVKR